MWSCLESNASVLIKERGWGGDWRQTGSKEEQHVKMALYRPRREARNRLLRQGYQKAPACQHPELVLAAPRNLSPHISAAEVPWLYCVVTAALANRSH